MEVVEVGEETTGMQITVAIHITVATTILTGIRNTSSLVFVVFHACIGLRSRRLHLIWEGNVPLQLSRPRALFPFRYSC
jgi:hypothetical protein